MDATVLESQQLLNKLGYGPVREDGAWGPQTQGAADEFTRDHPEANQSISGRFMKVLRQVSAGASVGVKEAGMEAGTMNWLLWSIAGVFLVYFYGRDDSKGRKRGRRRKR